MNSQVSTSFSGLRALFAVSVAVVAVVLVNAQFVHARDALPLSSPAIITANVQPSANDSVSSTPASVSYFDGINVAAISVAAYDQ